ncbi:uncharacterized protein LOC109543569 isoform X2 [Dendroctonus ponderosae]|uniref:uncharacterized protein LOC109543569 isoform X2 n=1 Tax=Dendroctonus ponderosae TaxID=77166 RepID=UPI002034CB14|nr:uncharacterized protein LOC109543569 isoform X2 [Dendroctonus ponderosae]
MEFDRKRWRSCNMSGRIGTRNRSEGDLVIDNVLSTQSELGPTIPDGGYGWIVFLVTLFFQLLIPSLLASFGILLPFVSMKSAEANGGTLKLWDNSILHTPLFFIASWTVWEPASRQFITHSKWPKLFATAGTCFICAGLLFLWMGITGNNQSWLFILSGILSGLGASIQMAQCQIIIAQYFRLKLPILNHLSHATSALGFILAPIVLGHHLLINSETQVILWYQAVILQGIVLNLFLRKPMYLKSKIVNSYDYVTTHPDDEEDIFSKNSRELQISVQSQHGAQIRTEELSGTQSNDEHHGHNEEGKNEQRANIENQATKNWETFDDDGEETTKYQRVENWDETTEPAGVADETIADKQQWQTFEDEPGSRNNKNLQLEMSFGTTREPSESRPAMDSTTITRTPMPLYSDSLPNNSNFSYDLAEDGPDASKFSIFVPIPVNSGTNHSFIVDIRSALELLREPTFYKSFLTVMTTKWSLFVFFSLYPSFLFQEVKEIRLSHLANLVGTISLATFLFSAVAYWINIEKKWRPKTIWILSWIGAIGYFMVSDYVSEGLLIFGAVQIVLSIAALEHVATPLLCMTVKGEATKEFTLICLLTGITLLFFVLVDSSLKQIFRMMALLNFLTGCMWLANYIYKRLFK